MSLLSRSFFGRLLLRPLHFLFLAWCDPESARAGSGQSYHRVHGHFETVGRKLVSDPMRALWLASGHAYRFRKRLGSQSGKDGETK
jgi:hypothetical protein